MKLIKYIALSLSLFTIFSCSNEIELAGPYKNIPVVYGLLDYKLDTNFIRINKAFLGNGNALLYAQEPDSLYYDSLHVYLLKFNGTSKTDSIVLFKTVNATQKDSGIFSNIDNVLYATTKTLDPQAEYEIHIYMPAWQEEISSRVKLCRSIQFSTPYSTATLIRFESLASNSPSESIRWTHDQNTKMYQLAMRFNYYEWPLDNPSNTTIKSAYREFNVFDGSTQIIANNVAYPITKGDFYATLTSRIQPNPNVARRVKDIDFKVFQIGPELQKYIEMNEPSFGLVNKTGTYTNLSGNALGIYSSRTTFEVKGYRFDNLTTDSIIGGQFTGNLGFTY